MSILLIFIPAALLVMIDDAITNYRKYHPKCKLYRKRKVHTFG